METQTENFAQLQQYVEKYRPQIENAMREHLPIAPPNVETQFNEAIENALFSGGNRLYAILTLLAAELFGGKAEVILPAASAVEFVHTSALVFDDFVRRDNAPQDKFSSYDKILIAIAFLNASYGLVFVNHNGLPERAMQAHAEIVECIGASGTIGMGAEKSAKDSALIRLALRLGAILSGANYLELAQLTRFAELLGEANRISYEDAKRILVENFPSSEARTCLIQLTDYLAAGKS